MVVLDTIRERALISRRVGTALEAVGRQMKLRRLRRLERFG
jgi:hypothetical protein